MSSPEKLVTRWRSTVIMNSTPGLRAQGSCCGLAPERRDGFRANNCDIRHVTVLDRLFTHRYDASAPEPSVHKPILSLPSKLKLVLGNVDGVFCASDLFFLRTSHKTSRQPRIRQDGNEAVVERTRFRSRRSSVSGRLTSHRVAGQLAADTDASGLSRANVSTVSVRRVVFTAVLRPVGFSSWIAYHSSWLSIKG